MSLDSIVDKLLENTKTDINDQMQTEIHPDLRFRRNTVNLVIGKKGSGKTDSVFREALKVSLIPESQYTLMLYVCDNQNDDTYLRYKDLIQIPVECITYEEADARIGELTDAKALYHEAKRTNTELEPDEKEELMKILHTDDLETTVQHTLVLLDDCVDIFKNKKSGLYKRLFRTRQPKITYFLCLQDVHQISTAIKANVDSLWFFGEFPWSKFLWMTNQFPLDCDKHQLWQKYQQLNRHNYIFIDYKLEGTEIQFCVNNWRK